MADISITREQAEKIMELYTNIEAADAHYQRCQSDYFRLHVQGCYKSQPIAEAFGAVKVKLEAPEKTTEKRGKTVLSKE